jgi:hypothetical protein
MKRSVLALFGLLFMTVLVRFVANKENEPVDKGSFGNENVAGKATKGLAVRQKALDAVTAEPQAVALIPTFFPKAKLVAKVSDPVDSKGRQKVIETVETGMREKFVRVVSTYVSDGQGGVRRTGELTMVANQLLLERPATLDAATFEKLIRQAGALNVKAINSDAFLATFASQPQNPRALDTYMSQVKQVAGTNVTVEPNYIRKAF